MKQNQNKSKEKVRYFILWMIFVANLFLTGVLMGRGFYLTAGVPFLISVISFVLLIRNTSVYTLD